MSVVSCQNCGEEVFTVDAWSDVDHCPRCGRVLASEPAIDETVRKRFQRELRRFESKQAPSRASTPAGRHGHRDGS